MLDSIFKLLINSTEIFGDERRRHFSKELMEKNQKVLDLENSRNPDYNDAKLALAKEDLENFVIAYQKEFEARVEELKAGGKLNE
jgi:hypothetical protein